MSTSLFDHSVNVISLSKNNKNYAMTCAWAMQVDYDKVICLIGEQSITGKNINNGDYIGISVLGISEITVATEIGNSHSNEINKINNYNFINYDGVYCLKNALIKMKCEVIDVLHLNGIESDYLVYAKVIKNDSLLNEPFLHMSDYK